MEVEQGRRDSSGVDFRGLDHMGSEGKGLTDTGWVSMPVAGIQDTGEGTGWGCRGGKIIFALPSWVLG